MSATETTSQLQADEEAIAAHLLTGKPLDPDVYERVHARAEKITEEVRRKHGEIDIEQLLGDARDEI